VTGKKTFATNFNDDFRKTRMKLTIAIQKYFSSTSYKSIQEFNPHYVKQIDHCAFRSMNKHQFKVIHDECISFGLLPQHDTYHFPEISVVASWYKCENTNNIKIPRVFSSLYIGKEKDEEELEKVKYFYEYYEKHLKMNHYIAWTTLFPFEINHIGFSVDNIKDVYSDLKKNGFQINGDIQVSDDKQLFQFSLKANQLNYPFPDGKRSVYGSFIEFVERRNQREGFHTKNASVIFQSTMKD
jgi:hypothetical protein